MKRNTGTYLLAIAVLFLLAGTGVQAQSTDILIGNPEQNVLYADLDNPLLAHVSDIADNSLILKCDEAKVFQRKGIWYVHPQKNDSTDWLSIKIFRKTSNGQNMFVAKKLFRVMKDPEQLACIVTPEHVYRTGDRVPVTELTDANTRIVPKYPDYIDYPETDLEMEQFTVMCQQKLMRCTNDTLSTAVKAVLSEALNQKNEVSLIIQSPRIGMRTEKSVTQRVLQISTFTIVNNR